MFGDNTALKSSLHSFFPTAYSQIESLFTNCDPMPAIFAVFNEINFTFLLIPNQNIALERRNYFTIIMQRFLQDICRNILICPSENFFENFSSKHSFRSKAHPSVTYKVVRETLDNIQPPRKIKFDTKDIMESLLDEQCRNVLLTNTNQITYCTQKTIQQLNLTMADNKCMKLIEFLQAHSDLSAFNSHKILEFCAQSRIFLSNKQKMDIEKIIMRHVPLYKNTIQYIQQQSKAVIQDLISTAKSSDSIRHAIDKDLMKKLCQTINEWLIPPKDREMCAEDLAEFVISTLQNFLNHIDNTIEIKLQPLDFVTKVKEINDKCNINKLRENFIKLIMLEVQSENQLDVHFDIHRLYYTPQFDSEHRLQGLSVNCSTPIQISFNELSLYMNLSEISESDRFELAKQIKLIACFSTNDSKSEIIIIKRPKIINKKLSSEYGHTILLHKSGLFRKLSDFYLSEVHAAYASNQNSQTLILCQISTGRVTQCSINELGQLCSSPILNLLNYPNKPSGVQSLALTVAQDLLILIDSNFRLYKLDISKENNGWLPLSIETNSNSIHKTDFKANNNYIYHTVQTIGEKTPVFFFQAKSCIDILDRNFCQICTIQMNETIQPCRMQIFTDFIDTYCVLLNAKVNEVYYIQNLISDTRIERQLSSTTLETSAKEYVGNRLLDIIKRGEMHFGRTDSSIETQYHFVLLSEYSTYSNRIAKYFKDLSLSAQLTIGYNEMDVKCSTEDIECIINNMRSRVPLQLCTIETGTLIPLNDGRHDRIYYPSSNSFRIDMKASELSFSYLDSILSEINEKICIVGIIGRQTSGKSYLLNKIFHTRFAVAAGRCTDGIWMSYTRIENIHFIVLDCEGLFSDQRTEDEEIKLISFLTAVCDITILNQDLGFSRFHDRLFAALSQAVEKISKSDILFKGILLITLRDISDKDVQESFAAAEKKFFDLQSKGKSGFLEQLFSSTYKVQLLHHFENKNFDDEIQDLRQTCINHTLDETERINSTYRWKNGKDLADRLKILLLQLYANDFLDSDEIQTEMKLSRLITKMKNAWTKFDLNNEKNIRLNEQYIEKTYEDKLYSIKLNHIDLQLTEDAFDQNFNNICEFILNQLYPQNYSKIETKEEKNQMQILVDQLIHEVMNYRQQQIKEWIIDRFKDEFPNEIENIKERKVKLMEWIEQYMLSFKLQICLKKCSKCDLRCIRRSQHMQEAKLLLETKKEELTRLQMSLPTETSNNDTNHIQELHEMISVARQKQTELENEKFRLHNEWDHLSEKEKLQTKINEYAFKVDMEKTKIKILTETIDEIENKLKVLPLIEENFNDKSRLLLKINEEMIHLLNPNQYKNDHLIKLINKFYHNSGIDRKPENELLCFEFREEQTESFESSSDSQCNTLLSFEMIDNNINKIDNYHSFIQQCLQKVEHHHTMRKEYSANIKNRIAIIEKQLNDIEKQKQIMTQSVKTQKIKYDDLMKQFAEINDEKETLLKKIDERTKQDETMDLLEISKIQHYIKDLQSNLNNCQSSCIDNESINQRKNQEYQKLQFFLKEKGGKESDLAAYKKEIELSNDNIQIKNLEEQITKKEHVITKLLESIHAVDERIKSIEEEKKNHQLTTELDELNQLMKNIRSYDERILSIEKRLSNAIKRKNMKEENIAKMKNEEMDDIEEEEKELIKLNETIEKNRIELDNIKQEKSSTFVDNNLLKKIISSHQHNIDQQQQMIQNRLNELSNSLKFLNENIEQILSSLSSNENILNDQEQKISDLKTNLDEQKAEQERYLNHVQINNESNEVESELLPSLKVTDELLFTTSKRVRELSNVNRLTHEYISSSVALTASIEEQNRLIVAQEQLSGQLNTNDSGLSCSYTTSQEYEEQCSKIDKEYSNACLHTENLKQKLFELDVYSHLKEDITHLESEIEEDCSCETDHRCSGICRICATDDVMKQNKCMFVAGHSGDHKCDAGHICEKFCQICEIHGLPKNRCRFAYEHKEPKYHQCEVTHQCRQKCACKNPCAIPLELRQHDIHQCNNKDCWKPCIFSCGNLCSNHDHNHDDTSEIVTITNDTGSYQVKKHLCNQPHYCKCLCNAPGICEQEYTYKTKRREWTTELGENFTYHHVEVEAARAKCMKQIPKGVTSHENAENHRCSGKHTCEERCPDCGSFCRKLHGHHGYHETLHRNKVVHIFASTNSGDQIRIRSKNLVTTTVKKYNIGELAKPENCNESCTRRGRSHFHLVECPGGLACWEKVFGNRAKHSNDTYCYESDVPNTKKFDQVLCSAYWALNKWLSPVINNVDRKLIDSCNTYCTKHVERDKNGIVKDSINGFCNLEAWHTGYHIFQCQANHYTLEMYQGIDVCFVIDTTTSMKSYFEKLTDTIARIMKDNQGPLKKIKSKSCFQFAIVDYQDHSPEGDYLFHKHDFTQHTTAINYVKKLRIGNGGDTPEAVLDALDAACELKWRENADHLLFHILDAPPHGRQYHTFAGDKWPDGCPCGKTAENILQKMKSKKISYYVLPATEFLNMMITEFKNYIDVNTLPFNNIIPLEDVIAKQVHQQLIDTEMILLTT